MGFTIAEKILALVSGKTEVRAGDDLLAKPDFVIAYDFPGYTDVIFRQMEEEFGIEKVADLPRALDTSDAPDSYKPETGDITVFAPWGNLAIFYKPFANSRGLVRLGQFDGPIDALVQDGGIPVRIEAAD